MPLLSYLSKYVVWPGLCLALQLLFVNTLQAHEFWLVPHDPATGTGDRVVFELRIGPTWPGEQSRRLPGLVDWFKATDVRGTREVAGREGSRSVGNIKTRVPGAMVVAMRTHPVPLELSAAEFNQYLSEEGLDEVVASRRRRGLDGAPGSEFFSRCAKSVVFVDGRSDGFAALTGLPLELVPQTDPLLFRPHQSFKVKLLFQGKPMADTLIKAQLKADPLVELTATSDAAGNVSFALPSPGLWLFNAVHMEPSTRAGVDWESLWASLTFEIPAAGKR